MIRLAKSLLLLFTLSLFSCGDSNLLMTLSDSKNAVTFRTSINSGDILNPESGETIDITMDYDEAIVRPVRLEIAFLDFQGLEISESQIIEGDKLNEPLPSISVSSPDENLYSLRLRVFDNDDVLIKEEIISFFYSRGSFIIRGIVAYPNTFVPGGQGLVFPDVEASDSSWVRWSIDNEIIEEGFLSQYKNGFIWKAPLLEGVYGLRMELFPIEPLYTTNGTFAFTSPLKSDIEIFVTRTITSDPFELYPSESYSTLIHFKGIVEDHGTVQDEIIPIGLPEVGKLGDKLGFYLNKDSGYLIDKNILPVTDGILMPFSVTFVYYLKEHQPDSYFLNIIGDNVEFFSIKTDSFGFLGAELSRSEGSITDIVPENYNEITLSVVPYEDKVAFYWYGDGRQIFSEISDYNAGVPDENYRSVIGAEKGFKGLLDEFGVYYLDEEGRNNIDDNIFERRINRKYNSEKIISAYGFDGLYSDDSLLSILSGSLILDSESIFRFLETDFNFSYLYIDIEFEEISDDAEISIDFPEESGEESIHISLKDLFSLEDPSLIPDDILNLEIELNIEDGILSVLNYGELIAEIAVQMHSPAVFYIANNSEIGVTKIVSLLVRREEKRVVEEIFENLETEL